MKIEGLDAIAVLEGTDKSSVEHDFARQYERAFTQFQNEPIDVIEIGVLTGSSLRMWEKYFSKARLIGVDIIDDCRRHAGGRKSVEIGSQYDADFLKYLCSTYSPSIIIDDGSHIAGHIKFTFEHLFPALQPGGCYVIEDLHFHQKNERAAGALDFVQELAFRVVSTRYKDALAQQIDRIEFIRHAGLIRKKVPDTDKSGTLVRMHSLVERSKSSSNWLSFVHYVFEHDGSLELAEHAARRSIELGMPKGLGQWRLSEVLEGKGDLDGALRAAEESYLLSNNPDVLNRINKLKGKMK
jgi:hypothetical protein